LAKYSFLYASRSFLISVDILAKFCNYWRICELTLSRLLSFIPALSIWTYAPKVVHESLPSIEGRKLPL
jgi:hypothetical protein